MNRDDLEREVRLRSAQPVGRRAFLAAGAVLFVSGCAREKSRVDRLMQTVSHLNDGLSARLFSPTKLSRKFEVSQRSPSFPSYFISPMTPQVTDPGNWGLEVGGRVRTPLTLRLDDIRSLGRLTYTVKHHCVEGWSAIGTWSGTPLRTIAERAGVLPDARYVRFDSFDSGYYNGWDLPSAMHPETILAWGFNDRELLPDHGAPLRLYAPHKLGYKLTKYLTRITFTTERPGGYWEDQGYPWFGGV